MKTGKTSTWQRQDKKERMLLSVMAVIGFVYFFLLGERGYVITPDSYSYINAGYEREPFYPVIFMISKRIFGERFFLYAVVILQGIVAYAVSLYVIRKFREYLQLNRWETFAAYLLLLLPYGLDTLWSQPRMVYTHIIMSDCFSYAFFYLFLVQMLSYLKRGKKGAFVWMLVLTSVMMLNRNQMEILFVNMAVASFLYCGVKGFRANWKRCLLELGAVILTFAITIAITLGYCYIQWGYFEKSSENEFTMMTNLLYIADAEDQYLFEDEENGETFAQLYALIDEAGWNAAHAQDGFFYKGEYMIECHDPIKSRIIRPFFENYVSEKGMEPKSFESDRVKKAVASEIKQVLLREHFGEWLLNAVSVMPRGFVYSVIPIIIPGTYPLMAVCAGIIWVVFIGGLVYLLLHEKRNSQEQYISFFAFEIACFMVMNVVGLCLVIFVLYRYLNYTQGLFWLIFYLVFRRIYRISKEKPQNVMTY